LPLPARWRSWSRPTALSTHALRNASREVGRRRLGRLLVSHVLEITRWHHVRSRLAFKSDAVPGTGVRPRPGMPLKLLYLACAAAPGVVVGEVIREIRTQRARPPLTHGERPELTDDERWGAGETSLFILYLVSSPAQCPLEDRGPKRAASWPPAR
jgi:hypothetical protein